MTTSLVPGSLGAIAQQSGKSIAETFMSADVIVIVDISGSMSSRDSRGGRSRWDVAGEELTNLQNSMPGKIAVIQFSDDVGFQPAGILSGPKTSTNLVKALKFVKVADEIPEMKFILISDGQPDDETAALWEAKTFQNKIDVIFVGPESDRFGRDFMNKLAAATGGQSVTAEAAKELSATVQRLLLSDKATA